MEAAMAVTKGLLRNPPCISDDTGRTRLRRSRNRCSLSLPPSASRSTVPSRRRCRQSILIHNPDCPFFVTAFDAIHCPGPKPIAGQSVTVHCTGFVLSRHGWMWESESGDSLKSKIPHFIFTLVWMETGDGDWRKYSMVLQIARSEKVFNV